MRVDPICTALERLGLVDDDASIRWVLERALRARAAWCRGLRLTPSPRSPRCDAMRPTC